jgi:hypothetical protein
MGNKVSSETSDLKPHEKDVSLIYNISIYFNKNRQIKIHFHLIR